MNNNTKVTLTKGQREAETMLAAFLDTDCYYASITGSAGVGKTFMMFRVLEHIGPNLCMFTAPTNKAVKVLSNMLPIESEPRTLHNFLGLGVKKIEGMSQSYRRDDYDPGVWQHIKVVIVDEASMLDDNLMRLIDEDAKEFQRQYIFVGDPCQLPPVEGSKKYSKSFDVAQPEFSIFLDEVVRQAKGNPIIKLATSIRNSILKGTEPALRGEINEETQQGIYLLNEKDFYAEMSELAGDPRVHEDPDFLKVIAWKNKTTREYNKDLRELMGMDLSTPFAVGDVAIVNSAYDVGGKIIAGTGDEVIVTAITEHTHPRYGYKSWQVMLGYTADTSITDAALYCLDDSAVSVCAAKLESLRQEELAKKPADRSWGAFYALQEYYIDIRPPYAITAHKAQGSTFEHVFVDIGDIYKNKRQITADKCYYVAVTRASHRVYIKM